MTKKRNAWLSDRRGSIAPVFGLCLTMLVATVGGAIDFSIAYGQRMKMQSALDTAALAAANLVDATLDKRKQVGKQMFDSNFPDHAEANFNLEVTTADRVRTTSQLPSRTSFLSVIGMQEILVGALAEVPILKRGQAEVVLVLDYSDSMVDDSKYVRMYEAAARMIDTISDNGNNKNVKFGLVPFSAVVRADIPAAYIRSDVTFDGCTVDRRYPYNTTEGVTPASDAGKWGEASAGGHLCANVAALNLKVLPLSDDLDNVKSTLSSFQPHLWTHIAAGMEFGWQVISPSGIYANARPYSDTTNVKAVIILTDGMQTAPGWGPSDSRTVGDAEANLSAICTGMKNQKINVYTVGYDLSDAHTATLLENCAGSGNYYASNDIDNGLMTMLAQISSDIQEKMLRIAR